MLVLLIRAGKSIRLEWVTPGCSATKNRILKFAYDKISFFYMGAGLTAWMQRLDCAIAAPWADSEEGGSGSSPWKITTNILFINNTCPDLLKKSMMARLISLKWYLDPLPSSTKKTSELDVLAYIKIRLSCNEAHTTKVFTLNVT